MRRGWFVAMLCIVGSCGTPELFQCESDAECDQGLCERNGFCSFEDGSCESGRRYGEHAGQLSGNCVAEPVGSTGVATETSGDTSSGEDPSTTSGDDERGTTAAVADTGPMTDSGSTSGASTTSLSGSSSDGGSSEGGESSSTGSDPMPNPYQGCMDPDECPTPGSVCGPISSTPPQCIPACMDAADCPEPPPPAMVATCVMNLCVLPCGAMEPCPADMECANLGFCAPID